MTCVYLLCSEELLNDVYGYWAAKRKRWGKPILRRLQAPTIASDTNPYNTFRYLCLRHHLLGFLFQGDLAVSHC